jgi:RimJ/RimL family protein N-acetyltransferase
VVYDGVIEGMTVHLRSVEELDAEVTFKMRLDPEKSRFIHRIKGTVEDQRNYIRRQREIPGDYIFLVEDLEGNPIGMKGVYKYDPEKKTVETGRFIGFGSQVQNIEALKLSFDFAFKELGVNEIIMSALENNTVMLGIQKRFGVEFTYREPCKGMDSDSLYSKLTKEAYEVSKPKIELLIQRFAGRK